VEVAINGSQPCKSYTDSDVVNLARLYINESVTLMIF